MDVGPKSMLYPSLGIENSSSSSSVYLSLTGIACVRKTQKEFYLLCILYYRTDFSMRYPPGGVIKQIPRLV